MLYIRDQEFLMEFIKDEKNGELRQEAVKQLIDKTLLAELAKNKNDNLVSIAAKDRWELLNKKEDEIEKLNTLPRPMR